VILKVSNIILISVYLGAISTSGFGFSDIRIFYPSIQSICKPRIKKSHCCAKKKKDKIFCSKSGGGQRYWKKAHYF
jgi:hypothetical protein